MTLTEAEILALQGHAIATSDIKLKWLAYAALGLSRVGFGPVLEGERRQAMQGCADQLEMMQAMGVKLRTVES